ncbi:hypothetical protein EVAR_21487_1 [Eumeta japonica]|uniref:Uncharacterized protein n=1 Tax=Eumeta variegata TaxID=151549 RepID=A0A4C1UYW7_EUMVA|nr:hypothetical protein EVAR_21487_1 [Eumeta japonica]
MEAFGLYAYTHSCTAWQRNVASIALCNGGARRAPRAIHERRTAGRGERTARCSRRGIETNTPAGESDAPRSVLEALRCFCARAQLGNESNSCSAGDTESERAPRVDAVVRIRSWDVMIVYD